MSRDSVDLNDAAGCCSGRDSGRPFFGRRAGLVLFLLCTVPGPGAASGGELSDYSTSLFSGAANCAFCHDHWRRGLVDAQGTDVSIGKDWRATMMAHSFKDPLWRATMEAEVAENPQIRGLIEDKCQRCHAAAARVQATASGTNELSFAASRQSPLANEGVGCTVCHQIQASGLGTYRTFTGGFAVGQDRQIFGPYDGVLEMPMRHHVNYTPVFGAHTQDSALCGTCHTLFTPILAPEGKMVGSFPEQTPYLEWRNSEFARKDKHCQDCHMPRLKGPIPISSRPPWLQGRQPFWRHQFAGANAFMLSLIARNSELLDANADAEHFDPLIEKSREQLKRAAKLDVRGRRKRDTLTLKIEIENLTGHKFPTGHPWRRVWLHVRLSEAGGKTLFESGAIDANGDITGVRNGSITPHKDGITRPEEVQVYQAVMGDANGSPTWSLLRASSYLKDNRLPPRGFQPDERDRGHIAVHGVNGDANFNSNASGRDEVTYTIPLPGVNGPVVAEVALLYQAVPPEAVARLLASSEPEAQQFSKLYGTCRNLVETVQAVRTKF